MNMDQDFVEDDGSISGRDKTFFNTPELNK
jgi:hypothetical protein